MHAARSGGGRDVLVAESTCCLSRRPSLTRGSGYEEMNIKCYYDEILGRWLHGAAETAGPATSQTSTIIAVLVEPQG